MSAFITATWPSGKAEACKAFTPGSNPGVASIYADVAQLVEHNLAKVGVAGSSPVVRSSLSLKTHHMMGLFVSLNGL